MCINLAEMVKNTPQQIQKYSSNICSTSATSCLQIECKQKCVFLSRNQMAPGLTGADKLGNLESKKK